MKRFLTLVLFVLVSTTTATAQTRSDTINALLAKLQAALAQAQSRDALKAALASPQGADPFARFFYPPELVMAHQGEIGLTDRQRSSITEMVKDSQGKFLDAQFKMSAATEKLGQIIQGATVDEAKVLEQVDQVLTLEREVKRAQLSLLVRIKNQLSAEQQAQLGKLRKQDWTRPPDL